MEGQTASLFGELGQVARKRGCTDGNVYLRRGRWQLRS